MRALLVVLLLAAACTSSSHRTPDHHPQFPNGPSKTFGNGHQVFVAQGQDARLPALADAARAHLDAFEHDQSTRFAPQRVGVVDGAPIVCDDQTFQVGGCTVGKEIVVSSYYDTLPLLYHELGHRFLNGDPKHQDARWSRWNERGREVVAAIESARR